MKKPRSSTPQTLRDILNFYPISEAQAFKIARVHRSTWQRWLDGKSRPPAAAVELIRLHALGELADPAFSGFRLVRGVLYDDNGQAHTPGDIRSAPYFKQKALEYFDVMQFNHFVPKAMETKKAEQQPGPKLRLVKR